MADPIVSPLSVQNSYFINAPRYTLRRSLAANVAETVIVPSGAEYVVMSCDVNFSAAYTWDTDGATVVATLTGDVTDGTASERNPSQRHIAGVTYISVIAADAGVITMSFYS